LKLLDFKELAEKIVKMQSTSYEQAIENIEDILKEYAEGGI